MLVKHIRSTVFGSASHFCHCFFLVLVGEGRLGAEGSVLSTMTGRVNTFASTFHGQACAFEQRTVETRRGDWVLTHFTDLVLKQYFTNDLLNLSVHHHKRYRSKMRKLDLFVPQSLGGSGAKGKESINLNASIINQIQ